QSAYVLLKNGLVLKQRRNCFFDTAVPVASGSGYAFAPGIKAAGASAAGVLPVEGAALRFRPRPGTGQPRLVVGRSQPGGARLRPANERSRPAAGRPRLAGEPRPAWAASGAWRDRRSAAGRRGPPGAGPVPRWASGRSPGGFSRSGFP